MRLSYSLKFTVLSIFVSIFILIFTPAPPVSPRPAQAQFPDAPCGIVDDIAYPVESITTVTLPNGYDDFARFRSRWGGYHVGLDVAFREQGEPVLAAARGRVTYSNIEGWDTEGGVVIIEHVFPTGEIYYTLYGHIEASDDIFLPDEGDCVELGDPVGVVGWPSMSAPHMHYEIRNFMPDDGGPGYVSGNPLRQGWFHPLDFTQLWKLRLSPGFVRATSFEMVPVLPPMPMNNGGQVITGGNIVSAVMPPDVVMWRVSMDDIISGVAVLPDNRIVARARSGQTATLAGGRYVALWSVGGPDVPFVALDETLIFVVNDGGLAAYNPMGESLWTVDAPTDSNGRISYFDANGSAVALAVSTEDGVLWRVVSAEGELLHETTLPGDPLVSPAGDASWLLLAGGDLMRANAGDVETLGALDVVPRRAAQFTTGYDGAMYLFKGDAAHTLVALEADGAIRWQTRVSGSEDAYLLAPLLYVDDNCLLYMLDTDGHLRILSTRSGEEMYHVQLYAGGTQSRRPAARLLRVDHNGQLQAGAGFLTLVTLDSLGAIGVEPGAACAIEPGESGMD